MFVNRFDFLFHELTLLIFLLNCRFFILPISSIHVFIQKEFTEHLLCVTSWGYSIDQAKSWPLKRAVCVTLILTLYFVIHVKNQLRCQIVPPGFPVHIFWQTVNHRGFRFNDAKIPNTKCHQPLVCQSRKCTQSNLVRSSTSLLAHSRTLHTHCSCLQFKPL